MQIRYLEPSLPICVKLLFYLCGFPVHSTTEKWQRLWSFCTPGKAVHFQKYRPFSFLQNPLERCFSSLFLRCVPSCFFPAVLQVPRLRPILSILPRRHAQSAKKDLQGTLWMPANRLIEKKKERERKTAFGIFWRVPAGICVLEFSEKTETSVNFKTSLGGVVIANRITSSIFFLLSTCTITQWTCRKIFPTSSFFFFLFLMFFPVFNIYYLTHAHRQSMRLKSKRSIKL